MESESFLDRRKNKDRGRPSKGHFRWTQAWTPMVLSPPDALSHACLCRSPVTRASSHHEPVQTGLLLWRNPGLPRKQSNNLCPQRPTCCRGWVGTVRFT
uniref:Uncharacterized protein n=1 Tax=Mustela putorius furo TaxID=9669 RepID=M3XVA7_MUSPF